MTDTHDEEAVVLKLPEPEAWMRQFIRYSGTDGRTDGECVVSERKVLDDDIPLFTAAQLTAAVMAERAERWRPIDSYKQRPEDGQRIFYYFEPFERWYNGVYVDGRVESQSGFSSFLPECPFWIPEPTVEPPAEDGDVHEQD